MKIATEEAFATPELVSTWRKLLDDGAPGEPGFKALSGHWTARVIEQLTDLGDIRLRQMDEGGVDMQLISIAAPGVQVFDADKANNLAEESNNVLAEAINAYPTRFAGLAAIAPQAPRSAAKELERALGLGLKGALINSHTKGEYLDALSFRPILEAAESLGVPLYIHPRTPPPAMLALFAERHFDRAFWGFQTETALHALRMIVTGVFDEFPRLKIVLGHLGEGVPFWLDRLDRQYTRSRNVRDSFPFWTAKRLPSDYFLENFFVTSSGHNWDPAVRFVEEVVGPDRLLFAADYPMEECKQQVEQANDISLSAPDKFFHLNPERIFGLS